jgi:hypothetical protein
MYPWLFERWDCGRVEDDNIDDETIAVRSNGEKALQSATREEGGGGEERYGRVEGEMMGGRGGDHHHGSLRRS